MSYQPAHSALFDNSPGPQQTPQPSSSSSRPGDDLQFFSSPYANSQYPSTFYNSQPANDPRGNLYDYGSSSGFWSAFGTGGFADEPPLLEELGLNFDHIRTKSLTVLNPFRTVPPTIMDDTDLAGPLLFIFLFGIFLMLSGKVHFGYIYGVGVLGVVSIYAILNLMSENGIDWSRTASVLGYCLLPMVMLSGFSIVLKLGGLVGSALAIISILWCTYSSSGMFTSVLHMNEQRFLVAYPVGLFYACFALMTVF